MPYWSTEVEEGHQKDLGRTFELVCCERCGTALATREQLAWVCRELGREIHKLVRAAGNGRGGDLFGPAVLIIR